ncbi:Crp/Fnr family transcriptional regulator [Oceanicoccus sagamiensis]|nr:Crp/Fnr family transcriptional regulator [Oceanicoccus sagamiensis]
MSGTPQLPCHKVALYEGLSEAEVAQLMAISRSKDVAAGEYLFHQHSNANSIYIIEEGVLMVERSSENGRRQIMSFMFPGNFVGFTHNDFFEYSVQTLTPARVLECSRHDFIRLGEAIPTLKKNVEVIGNKVMLGLFDQLFALGQKKAHERLGFLLQQLKDRQTISGGFSFELFMTRQDIADYLGLTLETVSRAFSRLQKEGVIKIQSAHHVEVLDAEQLKQLAFSN